MNTQTDPQHTPTPWRFVDSGGAGIQILGPVPFAAECVEFRLKQGEQPILGVKLILNGKETIIAYETWMQFPPKEWTDMQRANAALIVKAVNNHERLIRALQDLLDDHESLRRASGEAVAGPSSTVQQARAALAEIEKAAP